MDANGMLLQYVGAVVAVVAAVVAGAAEATEGRTTGNVVMNGVGIATPGNALTKTFLVAVVVVVVVVAGDAETEGMVIGSMPEAPVRTVVLDRLHRRGPQDLMAPLAMVADRPHRIRMLLLLHR